MRRATASPSGGADDTAPPDARVLDAVGDEAFARRAAAGDRDAYGELVRRHEAAAYRVAWAIVRGREDAEDAVQEAFVRAWRALGGFDPARPFRPWLMRIVANAALTLRARRRETLSMDDPDGVGELADPAAVSPADAAAATETADKVNKVVAAMSPANAAIFQMRYSGQMALDEIAEAVGSTPGAVAVALHRMREKLRAALFGAARGETK